MPGSIRYPSLSNYHATIMVMAGKAPGAGVLSFMRQPATQWATRDKALPHQDGAQAANALKILAAAWCMTLARHVR